MSKGKLRVQSQTRNCLLNFSLEVVGITVYNKTDYNSKLEYCKILFVNLMHEVNLFIQMHDTCREVGISLEYFFLLIS